MRARHLHFLILLLSLVLGATYLLSTRPTLAQAAAGTGDTVSPDRIRSTWGKALNPSNQVPVQGFRAIYFDRRNPRDLVFQENVDSVALKYAYNEFHNIDSPNFAAYWVGRLSFSEREIKRISVSQSWAKSRIFIDGEIAFDKANTNDSFTHDFAPGEHIIEVEYINNWHTTEYKVTIQNDARIWTKDEVAAFFRTSGDRSAQVYYAGVYESGAKDTTLRLSLPQTGKPVILVLSSYEAIDWRVASPDNVLAVVLSSNHPGSRVSGVEVKNLIHLKEGRVIYRPTADCNCTSGTYYCENRTDLNDIADEMRQMVGQDLAGYALKYSTEALSVQPYDQAMRRQIEQSKAARVEAQKACTSDPNPNFDELMLRR